MWGLYPIHRGHWVNIIQMKLLVYFVTIIRIPIVSYRIPLPSLLPVDSPNVDRELALQQNENCMDSNINDPCGAKHRR